MSLPGTYVRSFINLISERNIAVEQLLDGLPLDVGSLDLPRTRVPLAVCEAILTRAVELTRDPTLAVSLGTRLRPTTHGFLGFAAMSAATVGEAAALAVRFARTRATAVELALHVLDSSASLVLEERRPLPPTLRTFIVIAFFVEIALLARRWTGVDIDCVVECAFPARGHPSRLQGLDHVQFVFDAVAHRLVFPSSALELRLCDADPAASQLAREQCERELNEVGASGLAGRVGELLATRNGASLDDVAEGLKMSPRTLKRKLAEAGASFSHIRDEARRQRALLLLANRELSIGEIAKSLGYTELANFARAFRKWTGTTPHAYRLRLASK